VFLSIMKMARRKGETFARAWLKLACGRAGTNCKDGYTWMKVVLGVEKYFLRGVNVFYAAVRVGF
jgi:hypothetical protein